MLNAMLAVSVVTTSAGPEPNAWTLPCRTPFDLLAKDLYRVDLTKVTIPGTTMEFKRKKATGFSISFLPDFLDYETEAPGPNGGWSFSAPTSTGGLKGEILKRLGLIEVRSRGFGATFRFSEFPNWAFQFKGMRRVTIAYITRF